MPSRAYGLDSGHGTRVGTRAIPSAGAILCWLEGHAVEILVQAIPAGRRPKRRCVVQFRDVDGTVRTVGACNIAHVVWRAQLRLEAAQAEPAGKPSADGAGASLASASSRISQRSE